MGIGGAMTDEDQELVVDETPPWTGLEVSSDGPDVDAMKPRDAEEMGYGRGYRAGIGYQNARERRERIATAVLAGFCSANYPLSTDLQRKLPWEQAVAYADCLIAELDKEEK